MGFLVADLFFEVACRIGQQGEYRQEGLAIWGRELLAAERQVVQLDTTHHESILHREQVDGQVTLLGA